MWTSFSPSWVEQKDWQSPRRVNSVADGPQPWTTTLALSWGSSLPAYPADSGLANLQNCVSQSLKTNFSLYWSLFHLQHCLSSTYTHTHTPYQFCFSEWPFHSYFQKIIFHFFDPLCNPLQYSHLENPMDRGAVHGVAKGQTRLTRLSTHALNIWFLVH